jgi:hypothetical protein
MKRLTILLALILSSSLFAFDSGDIAIVLKSTGTVKIRSGNPGAWLLAEKGMSLNSGDLVKTDEKSFAAIMFTDDKSLLKVQENSTITINGDRQRTTIAKNLKFDLGQLWLKANKQESKIKIETPAGVAAVKGTEFYGLVDQSGKTTIYGLEGVVALENKHGSVDVTQGETGTVTKMEPPDIKKTVVEKQPVWATEQSAENYLEFEFIDDQGTPKNLKIYYEK